MSYLTSPFFVVQVHSWFCETRFDELMDLLFSVKISVDYATIKNRFLCLHHLLVYILKVNQHCDLFFVLFFVLLVLMFLTVVSLALVIGTFLIAELFFFMVGTRCTHTYQSQINKIWNNQHASQYMRWICFPVIHRTQLSACCIWLRSGWVIINLCVRACVCVCVCSWVYVCVCLFVCFCVCVCVHVH